MDGAATNGAVPDLVSTQTRDAILSLYGAAPAGAVVVPVVDGLVVVPVVVVVVV